MEQYDIVHWQNKLAIIIDAVNNAQVHQDLDDIIDNVHRHLTLGYRLLESLYYEIEEMAKNE
jgi:hypothetical protein